MGLAADHAESKLCGTVASVLLRLLRPSWGVTMALGAMLALTACTARTTGATKVTETSAVLHTTARCGKRETCTWYWEYWPANDPRSTSRKTPVQGPVSGPTGTRRLMTTIASLLPRTTYRWVFCGSPNDGSTYGCVGPNGKVGSTTADPPPDYATLTTAAPGTLAERWNGRRWRIQSTPNPSGATTSTLSDVSCVSREVCTAVGDYVSAGGTLTLAEAWDGTGWTIQPTPNPSGSTSINLSGVSCVSASACTAVGDYVSAAGTLTLAEAWDGTSWTIQPTPNPSGSTNSNLSGVSCASATSCTAVGSFSDSTGTFTLAERWDGTSWTIQSTANPTGAGPFLSRVSCTSSSHCTAVGAYDESACHSGQPCTELTLAEAWDGTSWTIQPTPNPAGAAYSDLIGVSCTSAAACTAVGQHADSNGFPVTLAEDWDGTSWTIQSTPNPIGATNPQNALEGVSCTSGTACAAVGSYENSALVPVTLAESWDGTSWTIQPTPNVTGSARQGLASVSCTSTTACTAVGND